MAKIMVDIPRLINNKLGMLKYDFNVNTRQEVIIKLLSDYLNIPVSKTIKTQKTYTKPIMETGEMDKKEVEYTK